jgi:hypothetical protein
MIPPPPRVEPLGGNRYRLVEDYVYAWKKEGVHAMLIVPAGFECDLASVPRILSWYISPFDLGSAVVPHDWISSTAATCRRARTCGSRRGSGWTWGCRGAAGMPTACLDG